MTTITRTGLTVADLTPALSFYTGYFGFELAEELSQDAGEVTVLRLGRSELALQRAHSEAERALPKSQFPEVLLYTPEYDALLARLRTDGAGLFEVPTGNPDMRIAITRDPSGNAVEIAARPDKPAAVGGCKLIVNDRAAAENFYVVVFGAQAQHYLNAEDLYDEVLMGFGARSPFLALFQPLAELPLPKSPFPRATLETEDLCLVEERLEHAGVAYERASLDTGQSVLRGQDPAGNRFEVYQA